MIYSRRLLIASMLCVPVHRAFAQFPAIPSDAKTVTIPEEMAKWFENLKRQEVLNAREHGDVVSQLPFTESCCGAGDAYPIIILEDAYPAHSGKIENGRARVTDTSARRILLPDGSSKYRQAITGNPEFKFSGNKITKEIQGNPTQTAWAFLRVMSQYSTISGGVIDYVWCVVPMPPSY
jgi:hypothetical protein